jgi:predicted GNAT family N-acyltransferase
MNAINGVIKETKSISQETLLELYKDVGWTSYLNSKEMLPDSVKNSLLIITYSIDGEIVGFARILGDGVFTILIQDLIVKVKMQRNKIGQELMNYILRRFKNVRQILVICDDRNDLKSFYRRFSLSEIDELNTKCFAILR